MKFYSIFTNKKEAKDTCSGCGKKMKAWTVECPKCGYMNTWNL